MEKLIGGPPTVVNYSGKDVPISDLVRAIGAVSGATLREFGGPDEKATLAKTVTVDWKNVPFWTAAAEVEKLTGLRWSYLGTYGLQLIKEDRFASGNLSGTLGGRDAFVQVVGVNVRRSSSFKAPLAGGPNFDTSSYANLDVVTYLDPKISATATTMNDIQIQGAEGGPWVKAGDSRGGIGAKKLLVSDSLLLPAQFQPGTTLAHIKGFVNVELARNAEVWSIGDIAASVGSNRTFGGLKYVLERVKPQGNKLLVDIVLDVPKGRNEYITVTERALQMKLTDAAGHNLTALPVRQDMTFEEDDIKTYDVQFLCDTGDPAVPIAPGPISLTWPVVSGVRNYRMPFEFRDVKVP